jgi:DNA segregation ATPase FtsK/SpoIIIE, S-DNA-T family
VADHRLDRPGRHGRLDPAPLARGDDHRRPGPFYRGRIILPVLVKVTSTRYVDRVAVRLVSGQSPADVAKQADNLAHGFGAMLCRVRTARSGAVVLEFVRRDALAAIIPAQPIPDRPDLKALPVGRREDGLPWLVRLQGTHILLAGATGAGKASLLWGLVRPCSRSCATAWSGSWPPTPS